MYTYQDLENLFRTCKNKEAGMKLENNTRLIKRGNAYAIRLHDTDVVEVFPDNTYKLSINGFNTAVTRDRLRRYSPVAIQVKKGVLWASNEVFREGMRVNQYGEVLNG